MTRPMAYLASPAVPTFFLEKRRSNGGVSNVLISTATTMAEKALPFRSPQRVEPERFTKALVTFCKKAEKPDNKSVSRQQAR